MFIPDNPKGVPWGKGLWRACVKDIARRLFDAFRQGRRRQHPNPQSEIRNPKSNGNNP